MMEQPMYDKPLRPFLKWLGGKTRLMPKVAHLLPKTYVHYYEPFVGGCGALFFVQPERATIGDVSKDLINVLQQVKDEPLLVIDRLQELKARHNAEEYYVVRAAFNVDNAEQDPLRAAQFIYLNCKCFNGLCRYNSKGKFNAPLHKISHVTSYVPTEDHILDASAYLSWNVDRIYLGDFRQISADPQSGDFVMIDPPYWPMWEHGFTTYTNGEFSTTDQIDLARLVGEWSVRGVKVMAWNSDTPQVRALYNWMKMTPVTVKSCVGQKSYDGHKPDRVELCMTNYEADHE